MTLSDKKTSVDNSNDLPGTRWLLHRSPWKPSHVNSYSDIANDTEQQLPAFLEELMNETGQNHLVFKLKPIMVFEGGDLAGSENQRALRAKYKTNSLESRGRARKTRQKRDVTVRMPERTVETLVVIDRMMMEYHKSKELLQPYVLTIMNIVSVNMHTFISHFGVRKPGSGVSNLVIISLVSKSELKKLNHVARESVFEVSDQIKYKIRLCSPCNIQTYNTACAYKNIQLGERGGFTEKQVRIHRPWNSINNCLR